MPTAAMNVGGGIRSWCTRCREMRDHVISEVEKDRPKRVTCRTCDGLHLYRPNPPRSRAKAAGTAVPKTTDWEDLMAVADLEKVQTYAMKGAFATGDVINHKSFGLGIVVQEMDEHKIQVSFQDAVRLLVRNRRK